jgi:WD40 repeat protein
MPSARAAALLALAAAVTAAAAEPDPADLRNKFDAEREAAAKAKFPPDAFAKADDLAKRAAAAVKADDPKAAARYLRDARWQLPHLPANLPPNVTRVLGESRMRHADRVSALVYSPDGTRLASCSKDGTVRVWDLGNGREVAAYRGHADQADDPTKGGTNVIGVADVAFHPTDPKRVASASGNQVHLWDADTGKPGKTLLSLGKNDKPVKALAFRPDGKALAVGSDDGVLRVVDTESGKVTYTSPPRNARIEKVAYSPNGKLVAVGDSNSFAAVYAPGQPNPVVMTAQVVGQGVVAGVAFTPDGGAVFTCGTDGKARLTAGPKPDGSAAANATTELRKFEGHARAVHGLAAAPDGSVLVTGGEDKTVRVWEVATGKQLRSLQGHLATVTAVAVRPDGAQAASGSEDGAIRVWDLGEDQHTAKADAADSLWAVAFSPDGKRVAAAGADKAVRVYDPETGKLLATLTGAKSAITSLAFLPDSNRLVAAGADQVLVVWDVDQGKPAGELAGHESAVLSVAAAADGKLVVSGSADKTARGFDPGAGKQVWKWEGKSAVCAVAVRKGNTSAAVGSADGSLSALDLSGPAPKAVTQPAHVAGVSCVAYSPDGSRLASVGGDGVLRVWTVGADGNFAPLVRFDPPAGKPGVPPSALTGVAFSPDGRYVAAVGADATARVWDVQTKSEVRGLRGHTDWATAVAFSPDGRYLASVGVEKDRALRLFELPPLEPAGGGGHALAVNAVAVSPDGRLAATAATDQTIKVWDLATGKEVATLIGNADTPYALAFLGNDALVMGGSLPTRDAGRLHVWGLNPGRLARAMTTGEVFTLVPAADGARYGAWVNRSGVGELKNSSYEVYAGKGAEGPELTITDKGRNVRCVTFAPDLTRAVSGDKSGVVRVWDLEKKEPVGGDWPLVDPAEPVDIGITPDKKTLVVADDKGVVKVADVGKREVLGSVAAHASGTRALVVSPAGDTFVTVSNDREVKAWSLAADALKGMKPVRTWTLPFGVNGVAYTPDGKKLVTGNADGTAYVLELP